jgi:CRISPR-associated Csx11 family protein
MTTIEPTSTQKKMLLWGEMCALLHDLGKLSAKFRDYRRIWQDRKTGWDDDPHCKLIENETLLTPDLRNVFDNCRLDMLGTSGEVYQGSDDFSISQSIRFHENPKDESMALRLLKLADAADARIDRHNPLMCNEQTVEPIYQGNVYGHEIVAPTPQQTDMLREELYKCLETSLPTYWESLKNIESDKSGLALADKRRTECLMAIRKAFDQALSDTTRPANDTTLWEHCYAVASLHKTLASHSLIYKVKPKKISDGGLKAVCFGFLAVGWDGLGFLADSRKVGDVLARQELIDTFKAEIRCLIEVQACLGNAVYEDERSLIFLVPACPDQGNDRDTSDPDSGFEGDKPAYPNDSLEPYKVYLRELEGKIKRIVWDASDGELCPLVILPTEHTQFMTHIVEAHGKLKTAFSRLHHDVNQEMLHGLASQWSGSNSQPLCPLCRLRPVKNRNHQQPLCVPCQERRKNAESAKSAHKSNQTPFINEIADDHGRVCLLVARFDLDQWLSGDMVRTTFNREAHGLEREFAHIGTKAALKTKGETPFRSILDSYASDEKLVVYDYDRIMREIEKCQNVQSDLVEAFLGLYHRRPVNKDNPKLNEAREYWKSLSEAVSREHDKPIEAGLLVNALLAKTPTPSTILDVWNSTHKFITLAVSQALNDTIDEARGWSFALETYDNLEQPLRDFKGVAQAQLEVVGGENKGTKIDVEVAWRDGRYLLLTKQAGRILASTKEGKPTIIIQRMLFDNDVKLSANEHGREGKIVNPQQDRTYRPWREIISSPYLFLALLPADKAPDVLEGVHTKYLEHFGKVQGRLPFSLGAIFCDSHMPMYILLDAARRMLDGFSQPDGQPPYQATWQVKKEPRRENGHWVVEFAGGQAWRVPATLGDCENDWFHPHVVLADGEAKKQRERKTYCRTVAGETVHVADLQAGDQVQVCCNTFDFEFLDATTRRFELASQGQGFGGRPIRPRGQRPGPATRPYFLEDMTGLFDLWKHWLRGKGYTNSKLHNLELLLATQWEELDSLDGQERTAAWNELARSVACKELGADAWREDDPMHLALRSGRFMDCLELYLHILKQKVEG